MEGNSGPNPLTTGEDDADNGRGQQGQRARTVTTTGMEDNNGKDDNSKDNGNDGKDNQQGR
jgi:hypothetical protein